MHHWVSLNTVAHSSHTKCGSKFFLFGRNFLLDALSPEEPGVDKSKYDEMFTNPSVLMKVNSTTFIVIIIYFTKRVTKTDYSIFVISPPYTFVTFFVYTIHLSTTWACQSRGISCLLINSVISLRLSVSAVK